MRIVAEAYLASLRELLADIDLDALQRVLRRLSDARDRQGTIFIAGNGGSAATATGWANDLCKATRADHRVPMKATSLSDNTSFLTALANDEGYGRVFAGQLESYGHPGDVLVVISASGNSENLVQAVETAKQHGLTTIALLGFDGGILREMVDEFVWLPTEIGAYGLVESGHSVVADIITTCLIEDAVTGEGARDA